jgi:hypothetical protein
MRFRRRYAILALAFASVAALTVGGIASATHTQNVSSIPTWNVAPSALPGPGGTPPFANVALTVQVHTNYAHPNQAALGGKSKTVTLDFDDDVRVNLTGVPSCTATFGSGTTISQAWERCGPGADQAGEVNAYLSPPTAVSGTISTAPAANFAGCNLIFKRSSTSLLLFARATFAQTANCSSPATNTSGNTSVTLVGNLSSITATDFRTRLRVPNIDASPLPLDDFKSTVKRGAVFQARCRDANRLLGLRVNWVYSGSGQTPDTVTKQKACT